MTSSHSRNDLPGDVLAGRQVLERPWEAPGYLMIIGGADRLDPEAALSRLFLALVDRTEDNSGQRGIVIVTSATRHPEILTSEYTRIFTRLGVDPSRISAPIISTRDEAHDLERVSLLAGAAGIFITGGDQYRLAGVLDRTPAEDAIMTAYGTGAVIAGTSAGATAMGRPMVVAGGGTGDLRAGVVQMSHGLGWAGDDMIIDTHFGARGRFPRLASAVAEHPAALGVGIDENTCLLLNAGGEGLVLGAGVVYFVDGSDLLINTAAHGHSGHPISVGPLTVNAIAAGGEFDLRHRRVVLAGRRAATV